MALLELQKEGLYCAQADVYIDPWKPVASALITHGHADHARWGSRHYLCTQSAKPVLQYRLGRSSPIETVAYGERRQINGVKISFHPAGHIIGSAQIRLEYKGEIWVVSGDYKLEDDGLSEAFEPVPCHTFITESTFGLPVYKWPDQEEVFQAINQWWADNQASGKTSVLTAYALGKAQRLLAGINPAIGPIFAHGAIENTNQIIRKQGIVLPPTPKIEAVKSKDQLAGALVLATPSALGTAWMKRFKSTSTGMASGWMALRGTRRRRAADRGFVLSDHADWEGLNQAVEATGAERVYVTHGYTNTFVRWLREKGLEAYELETEFEGETGEMAATEETQETD
ncbi:MAG: ligase-associated DNA damage response exonuclease [Phaeodactylibacter sp.]|nr:ligase-associated DNA damage response exonuclease [Phaeodactylibacter sp.]